MEENFKKVGVKRPVGRRPKKKTVLAPLPPEASARVSAAAAAAGAVKKPIPASSLATTIAAAPVQAPAPKPVEVVAPPAPPAKTTRKVELSFDAPLAQQVNVAGDFNAWEMTTLVLRKTDGLWKITLELKPGAYQYKFLVDGEWVNDPNNVRTAPNEFGSLNNVLEVN